MILFFSGTGNSKYVADYFAKALQDDAVDAGKAMKMNTENVFFADKPYIFVCPIYSWRMPAVFEAFLRGATFSGTKKAYFVMTCGGDMGAAGKYAAKLCREIGLEYCGSLEVVMPDNYILMFSAPKPKEAREIVERAVPTIQKGIQCIQQGENFPEKKCGFFDEVKSGIVNTGFNKYFVNAKGFYATEKCVGCGYCVAACPLNNISLSDGKPVWSEHCTQCMACICGCPKEAIEYGRKTEGKVRYQCPNIHEE